MCLQFLNMELKEQFNDSKFNPVTKALAFMMSAYCFHHFQETLWVSSLYREGEFKSPHGWWNAIDLDNDHLTIFQKLELEDWVNSIFQYDPKREEKKVCYLHTVKGRGGDHFHVQSREFTILNLKKEN